MRCANCGEELREGAKFCPTCGVPTTQTVPVTGAPTVQVVRPADPARARATAAPPAPPASPEATPTPEETTSRSRDTSAAARRDPGADYDPTGASAEPSRPARTRAAARAPSRPSMISGADFATLWQRLVRLFRLDTEVFADVYKDSSATIPIAVFVAALFVIAGVGGFLYIGQAFGFEQYEVRGNSAGEFFLRSVILGTVFGLLMWAAWSGVTMLLLQQLAGVDVDFLSIARVLGLALLPLVLSLLLFIDDFFLALSWITLAGIAALALIGVLEAVDVGPGPAWVATLAGFAVFVIGLTVLGDGFRDLAPGFFGAAF